MPDCQNCGNNYPDSEMADWTICNNCKQEELERMRYSYMDSLGIGWSKEDIINIGGISEIERLISENRD